MAKIEVTRTELVWPGKYNEDGTLRETPRVSLPFQVIERINESRADREASKMPRQATLFDIYQADEGTTFEDGWRNKLIWGDNLLVMGSLLEKFAGKIDLIYIDPPFATGADFSFETQIGDGDLKVTKEQSIIEEKAYRDTWGGGIESFLSMIKLRLELMCDLLRTGGSIHVHVDFRTVHPVKVLMDEVFDAANFRNHLVWVFEGRELSKTQYNAKHNDILFYSKGDQFKFNYEQILEPLKESSRKAMSRHVDETGRPYIIRYKVGGGFAPAEQEGRTYRQYVPEGVPPRDWFFVDYARKDERTGYDTQKPEALLSKFILASSDPGDLVADFFCGSGTTLAVAEKLGRRWIGCDLGRWAIHVTRKRLLGIKGCRPFEVLNLGKYERQYWQGVTFGDAKDKPLTERALYEYLAFILKLYGAQPVAGMAHIHGKKGKALVHIGAVDAPVTIDETNLAIAECVSLKQSELHVLGWEWEMGLYDLIISEARRRGIKLLLLQIPREVMEQQAVDRGDIRFFELAYLKVQIKRAKGLRRSVVVSLQDFVIPNTELIPDDVRDKVKKWSDYIDYWAVDWDFQNDTFMQGWVAYRTRKNRALPLASDPHTYEGPGRHRVLVKVVDIFGNDTTQGFTLEVK